MVGASSADLRTSLERRYEMPITYQFKSMNDLVDYLNQMETRLASVETENADLRARYQHIDTRSKDVIAFVKENWPKTSLVSKSWWVRALAVYGYFFVINLIVSAVLGILSMIIFGSMIASALTQLGPTGIQ
jgi:hypothetical protein